MSQYDEENAFEGHRGGEVYDETMREAWKNAEELNDEPIPDELGEGADDNS